MKLKKVSTINIVPTTPFNFDATFHKPDHFTSGDNYWEPSTRWQTWSYQGQSLGLKFSGIGNIERPEISLDIYASNILPASLIGSLIDESKYRYNLDFDLSDFYRQFGSDAILGPIIEKWRGMRPGHPRSLYEYLIIRIVLPKTAIPLSWVVGVYGVFGSQAG